jgi:hypothetical protein
VEGKMAYQGYLIKLGDTILPHKYIKADSYSTTLIVQDLDSYRDMEGVLHRTALNHRVNKIEFSTPAMMTEKQMAEFLTLISSNYINVAERKVMATVYVPEINDYMTQEMYFPDVTFSMYGILNGVIRYNSIRFALIAY